MRTNPPRRKAGSVATAAPEPEREHEVNETNIAWTKLTWNPVSGCKELTSGCAFCYAKTLSENKRGTPGFPNGFDLTYRPHKMREPLRIKEPSLIFVNSMSDFFWNEISDDYRHQMVDIMEQCPQHEFQVLTKRPEEMVRFAKLRKLPGNFWAGVTIESQRYVDERLALLKQVDASVRFVSAEPLLTALDFGDLSGVHWVIGGGESGPHLTDAKLRESRGMVDYVKTQPRWVPRADRIEWARSMRDQCTSQGVAFFWKQWGGLFPTSGGNELDGRTWEQFPRLPQALAPAQAML